MVSSLSLPITDAKEVEALLDELPIAVKREHFVNFVLGFPRKYLVSTPRVEIVKHYLLMEGLGDKPVISSLSREKDLWKLSLVTRDRRFLFSRICAGLSCFGMNIVEAQAFANANSLVLDTFQFLDSENYFGDDEHRRNFHHLMEEVVEGNKDLEPLLRRRWEQIMPSELEAFAVELDNDTHPSATRLALDCHDHFGLLYLVSRCISEGGYDIEIAYVQTPGREVHDEFYLTHKGAKLTPSMQETLKEKLALLGEHYLASVEGSKWNVEGSQVER